MGMRMGTYRKFVWSLLVLLLLFIGINLLIWKCYTEKVLASTNGGDLARLGYVSWVKIPRDNITDLPRQHIEQEDYAGQPIDMMTYGDSFSNGGGGGKNRYYQDYIASINSFNVLNVEPFMDPDFMTTVAIMYNNGYLDSIHPKYFLLSSSEKQCIERFVRDVDFSKNMSMPELLQHKRMGFKAATRVSAYANALGFMNSGNYKFLLNSILYRYSSNAYYSKVFMANLTTPFFDNSCPNKLLYYKDDVTTIFRLNTGAVNKINDNMNKVADLLMKKGIKLYFMPCVDKYDLYSDYIVGNKFPKNMFFEELRKLPRRYVLIDTKQILAEELRKGEKDVFYADDTHWTWKASRKIFETVRFP